MSRKKTKNQNTCNSTTNWLRVFQSWAQTRKLSGEIEKYDPETLNSTLEKFYVEVRKKNGKE